MTLDARLYPLDHNAWPTWGPVWNAIQMLGSSPVPFLDWEWLLLWWKHFNASSGEAAYLCVAFEGDEPIGALPVVAGTVRRGRLFHLHSVQVMGNRLFDRRSIFSEYLDVIAVPGREAEVRARAVEAIREHFRPAEMAIGWTRQPDAWLRELGRVGNYVRIASHERSYQADLSSGFANYAAQLGASTRRSVIHLRSRLEQAGPLRIAEAGSAAEAHQMLDELNRLHARRWGKPAFSGTALAFHRELIQLWMPRRRVVLTSLHAGSNCISTCYDLRIGARQFNIQLGFDPAFAPKASPGLIHLGFAMERAASEGVTTYDFLAGRGRRSDYKKNLATHSQDVCTVQALRGPVGNLFYRMVDLVRAGTARNTKPRFQH